MLGRTFSRVLNSISLAGRMQRWNRAGIGIVGAIGLALSGTSAYAATIFGPKLTHEPTPAETCRANKPANMCTWVMTIAQQNVGHERAPKNGTIVKLRLRSCTPGSFVLQLARAFPSSNQARVVRTGPAINYTGKASNCNGGAVFIETFNVNVPVQTGDYLAVIATKIGFIYNASGDGTMVFDPPLADGTAFKAAVTSGTGSGILLLQAQYND